MAPYGSNSNLPYFRLIFRTAFSVKGNLVSQNIVALNRTQWKVQSGVSALANTKADTVETELSKPSAVLLSTEITDSSMPWRISGFLLFASAPLGLITALGQTPVDLYIAVLVAIVAGPFAGLKAFLSFRNVSRTLNTEFGGKVSKEVVQKVRRVQKSLSAGQSETIPVNELVEHTFIEALSRNHDMELSLVIREHDLKLAWTRIIDPNALWEDLLKDVVDFYSLKKEHVDRSNSMSINTENLMKDFKRQKRISLANQLY